jgi:4-hydroxy-tetrahydrodipicolinate synthase
VSTQNNPFGQVLVALVTPFAADGEVDWSDVEKHIDDVINDGADGIVVTGTTGETSTLTDPEKLKLVEVAKKVANGRAKIITGGGSNETAHAIELYKHSEKAGADGVMIVTPYYNKPTQAGVLTHFRMIADATDLPVILYDIPVRSGRRIKTTTMLRLAREVPNVVALKDAAGDSATTAHLVAQAPPGFEVYSGDDIMTLPLLSIGAVGVISVASHWVGPQFRRVIDAFLSGHLAEAVAGHAELLDSFDFESSEEFPNPLPAKAVLRALGLRVGQCRLPMGDATPDLDAQAAKILAAVGPPAVTAGPLA